MAKVNEKDRARLAALALKKEQRAERLRQADTEAIAVARGIAAVMLDAYAVSLTDPGEYNRRVLDGTWDYTREDWEAMDKLALLAYRREYPKSRGSQLWVWVPHEYTATTTRYSWIGGPVLPAGRKSAGGIGDAVCRFCRVTLQENVNKGVDAGEKWPHVGEHTTQCALEYLSGIRRAVGPGNKPAPEEAQ